MDQRHSQNHAPFIGWRQASLVIGVVLLIMLGLARGYFAVQDTGAFGLARAGRYGMTAASLDGFGKVRVILVTPGGAGDMAGIKPGDTVQFDHIQEYLDQRPAGTPTAVTIVHAGQSRRATLVAHPLDPQTEPGMATTIQSAANAVFQFLLGIILIVRGWRQPAALALGIALTASSFQDAFPSFLVGTPWFGIVLAIQFINRCLGLAAEPACYILLYARYVGRPPRLALSITTLGIAYAITETAYGNLVFVRLVAFHSIDYITSWIAIPLYGLPMFWWLWRGYSLASPEDRNRFGALLAANALILPVIGLNAIGPYGLDWISRNFILLSFALIEVSVSVRLLVTAYAVLRHRVVDLGFALSRTVIYGTVSVILLGGFGLIEWGIEHLLPEEWVKASAWFDAGAAVLVYLAFHRVHDWVEHRVEHLFFHHWQANEAELRRFVAAAAHFEDAPALERAFAEELTRFGEGARVALYRRARGALVRVAGTWPDAPVEFREETKAFAPLRAERAPLDLADTQTDLPGALALPMLDHGALAGLVLMEAKGNGALYRPDEVALLGWAVHEVGLAMAALHTRAIDAEMEQLKHQNAELRALVGGWRKRAEA